MVKLISTKIGNFIENRQIFVLLYCNCAKLSNIEHFTTCSWGRFCGHSVYCKHNNIIHWFLGDRVQNGSPYAIGPLSVCPVCPVLSVTLVYCGQMVWQIKMKLGMQVGLGPGHIVLDGDPAPSAPNFRPISVAAKWLHRSRCHLVWR